MGRDDLPTAYDTHGSFTARVDVITGNDTLHGNCEFGAKAEDTYLESYNH